MSVQRRGEADRQRLVLQPVCGAGNFGDAVEDLACAGVLVRDGDGAAVGQRRSHLAAGEAGVEPPARRGIVDAVFATQRCAVRGVTPGENAIAAAVLAIRRPGNDMAGLG